MKIIIFMYGHMRTYKKTYKSFNKNIVEYNKLRNLDVQMYLATWAVNNIGGRIISEKEKIFIQNIYQPKKLVFTNSSDSNYINYKKNNLKNNQLITVNVSYLLKKCFSYASDEIENCDYVVLTRPDIFFHEPLDFTNIFNKTARGYQTIKTDNNIFCPYVLSSNLCEINDYSQYICGIDLLSIYSKNAIKNINIWDISKKGFETLLPEFSMTKLFNENNVNYFQIAYEKDKCFEIQRKRIFPFNIIFSEKSQIAFSLVLYILYPILIFSNKFRKKIFFNKHLLSLRNIKLLLRFLK